MGIEEGSVKDGVIVRAIATDNLVSRNAARYPVAELPMLVELLPGKPATLDHAWGGVASEWGVITSAAMERVEPPASLTSEDAAIVKAEGYFQVVVEITCPSGTSYLADFDNGIRTHCSIAAGYTFMRCPGCKCGEDMFSRECVNDFWSLPYYERVGVVDAFEISLVTVPAVKAAQILIEEESE